jgi:hypothetical protein
MERALLCLSVILKGAQNWLAVTYGAVSAGIACKVGGQERGELCQ